MITRNFVNSIVFTASLALSACGPTPATTEGVNVGDRVAPEDRPPYRVYDNWDSQTRFSTPYSVYQNVDYNDVPDLLTNNTFVGYFEGGEDDDYGLVHVIHYSTDRMFTCQTFDQETESKTFWWQPIMWEDVRRNLQYPYVEYSLSPNFSEIYGDRNIQYNSTTGGLAYLLADNGKWWDMDKGHIQHGIPAAVYEICPGFPSAQSLGVPLIQDQTATNYFELLEQNSGNRIIRPDLVTDYTPRHWFPE